jgi:Reverse transcriptase (RNA-dependent DNA polymerase)
MRRAKGVVGNSSRDQRSAANAIAAELSRLRNDMTSEEEKQQIRDRIAQRNVHRLANVEHGQTIAAAIAVNTPPRISATDRIFRCNAEQVKSQDEMIGLFAACGCHIEIAGDFQPPIYWMESILEAIIKERESDEEEPTPLSIPKPPLFKRSDALTDVWRNADAREIGKIMAEGTFKELPIDPQGKYIEPPNAIHQRLLRVREWKWKKSHPETELPGWCACVRIVIDGSKDLRTDSYYALCPDRVILFLLLAIAAATESELSTSDVERAYLNALAIDRNIVVIASSDMFPIPRRSLLDKALYGARCAAKSWQDWIDKKMEELGYDRLKICKGIYIKFDEETGALLHAYRHSDDFMFSCDWERFKLSEEKSIRSTVRMSAFIPPTKFLGVEITRVEYETGKPSSTGNVLILRQVGKINEMAVEFAQDIEALFPAAKGVILKTPLPGNHNRPVEELTPMMQTLCTPALITRMMEMNGCVLWVASSTRHDLRFAVHWCSTKIVAPIFRDYYMCVHMVLYLIQTKMYPLLLGGPGPIDAYGYSDGSLHTGSKMRSVGSYFVFATPLGGAIQSNTFETKYQVLNVMHVELDAITQLANALLYVTHACLELNAQAPTTRRIFSPITRRIYTDSEAAQAHCLNNSASKKSKHLELRLQTVQDYQEDD